MLIVNAGESDRTHSGGGDGTLQVSGTGGIGHGIVAHALIDARLVESATCVVGVTGTVSVIVAPTAKALVKVTLQDGIGLVLEVKLAGQLSVCPPLIVAPPV